MIHNLNTYEGISRTLKCKTTPMFDGAKQQKNVEYKLRSDMKAAANLSF